MLKKLLFTTFLIPTIAFGQSGVYSVGASCVYQHWKESFDVAPIVGVSINKTCFSFSTTLNKGEGKRLSSMLGSDWSTTGIRVTSFAIGYEIGVEDVDVWVIPYVGFAMRREVLQTDKGWLLGQSNPFPVVRIEVRSEVTKFGLGYWLSFGNVENGAIGIYWRYNKKK